MFALFLTLGGGFLLFLSQPPRRLAGLQIPALACFAAAIFDSSSLQNGALFGSVFGVAYVLPTLAQLRLVPLISLVLALIQIAEWALLGILVARFSILAAPFDVLASACAASAIGFLGATLLPLWGHAQSWARPWCAHPKAVRFVAHTGIFGVHFALFTLAALAIRAFQNSQSAPIYLSIFGILLAILAISNGNRSKPIARLKVAALGWCESNFGTTEEKQLVFDRLLREAIEAGAQLVVTPETAFHVENRESWRRSVGAIAAKSQIALAVGYFDAQKSENCIDFVSCDGEICGRYLKTHLVPIFEKYNAGRGLRSGLTFQNVKVAGLICQDDNFPDIARGNGRDGAQIVAIPTNDWRFIKDFHLTSCRWRALEMRFGVVRAASNGISAITSAHGELLARCDHFSSGAQVLVAEIEVEKSNPTLYARFGDWFSIACAILVLAALILTR